MQQLQQIGFILRYVILGLTNSALLSDCNMVKYLLRSQHGPIVQRRWKAKQPP